VKIGLTEGIGHIDGPFIIPVPTKYKEYYTENKDWYLDSYPGGGFKFSGKFSEEPPVIRAQL
jgi:hypothetical protein